MIRIYGDSITAGSPGVSYCDYLKDRLSFKKYGVGGDTVSGLLIRIKKSGVSANDLLIVEIGANDLLLPYLCTLSKNWESTIDNIERSGRKPAKTSCEFSDTYEELLRFIGSIQTIVVSIPCIGEDIQSEINAKVDGYNSIIRELCKKHQKCFLDFNHWQKGEIARIESPVNNRYFIKNNPNGMIIDVMLTRVLGLTDYLSRRRKLSTTVDGVHLNSRGAKGLARMIAGVIDTIAPN